MKERQYEENTHYTTWASLREREHAERLGRTCAETSPLMDPHESTGFSVALVSHPLMKRYKRGTINETSKLFLLAEWSGSSLLSMETYFPQLSRLLSPYLTEPNSQICGQSIFGFLFQ